MRTRKWVSLNVFQNGAVVCWGGNSYGQLGDGSTDDSGVPAPVSGLASGVNAITPGEFHTCAQVNGGVWCWGMDDTIDPTAEITLACS